MIETLKHRGIFHVYDNPGLPLDELSDWMSQGFNLGDFIGLKNKQRCPNILMASQKLAMANAVYPTIDRLVITTQTETPADSETSYSELAEIYTTGNADEFYRSGAANPYRIAWNITSDSANGTWGSFILITESGAMINRALAGVTKAANTTKIVDFEGLVTS